MRENLQSIILNERYSVSQETTYDASEMTPRVLCMYFVLTMLTTGSC